MLAPCAHAFDVESESAYKCTSKPTSKPTTAAACAALNRRATALLGGGPVHNARFGPYGALNPYVRDGFCARLKNAAGSLHCSPGQDEDLTTFTDVVMIAKSQFSTCVLFDTGRVACSTRA